MDYWVGLALAAASDLFAYDRRDQAPEPFDHQRKAAWRVRVALPVTFPPQSIERHVLTGSSKTSRLHLGEEVYGRPPLKRGVRWQREVATPLFVRIEHTGPYDYRGSVRLFSKATDVIVDLSRSYAKGSLAHSPIRQMPLPLLMKTFHAHMTSELRHKLFDH